MRSLDGPVNINDIIFNEFAGFQMETQKSIRRLLSMINFENRRQPSYNQFLFSYSLFYERVNKITLVLS